MSPRRARAESPARSLKKPSPKKNSLDKYERMRNFGRTPEPSGNAAKRRRPVVEPQFVIQKHAARRLHYDLRLEHDGVLKSWAVPKGPSLDPAVSRLAIEVEDHPLSYAGFEGEIPEGEYGAGSVLVWDRGIWHSGDDPAKALKRGKLHFTLEGEKLGGEWLLVRTSTAKKSDKTQWLLRKISDEYARNGAGDILVEQPGSVLSASAARGKRGKSARKSASGKARATTRRGSVSGAFAWSKRLAALSPPTARLPASISPQLATLVKKVPQGDVWLHEIKIDGYRLLARKDGLRLSLLTRNGKNWTAKFPDIAEAVAGLPCETAIVDGEAAVVRPDGTTSFQALQNLLDEEGMAGSQVTFFAFDLLYLEGRDLTGLKLIERKELLRALLSSSKKTGEALRYCDHLEEGAEAALEELCCKGAEGLVSKRRDSRYQQRRSKSWLKIKCASHDDFLIIGMTPLKKQKEVAALILADAAGGELSYAGKVGTGFGTAERRRLFAELAPFKQPRPAIADAPKSADAIWLSPELSAEVRFTERTRDGRLRHPVYLGMRRDKGKGNGKTARKRNRKSVSRAEIKENTVGKKTGKRKTTKRSVLGGRDEIALTNADRVVYPKHGITKGDIWRYYDAIADLLLADAAHRPLSIVRCPKGISGACFFQKHPGAADSYLKSTDLTPGDANDEEYLVIHNRRDLMQLIQFGTLEIHAWNALVEKIDTPDRLILDLDPGEGVAKADVVKAARYLREALDHLELASFVKTTGGKGLHVVVPLVPGRSTDVVKNFGKMLAQLLAQAHPDRFVTTMTKSKRKNRIYIDYLRNGREATAIVNYSTRARDGAPVAIPVGWSELQSRFGSAIDIHSVLRRVASLKRDPWEGFEKSAGLLDDETLSAVGIDPQDTD